MLATAALLVVLMGPVEPNRYIALNLYTIYSAIFLILSITHRELVSPRLMHWLDAAWYLAIVALSGGSNSIFFTYFFFVILVASFGWGYSEGLGVTLVSAALFTIIGVFATPSPLELNQFLLRPIELLVLGFMISRWGGFKIKLRNRLNLLKDITVLSNGRFGIDRTITAILESLRAFYDADACLLLLSTRNRGEADYQMYRVRRDAYSTGAAPSTISAEAASLFLVPSPVHAVIHHKNGQGKTSCFDLNTRQSFVDHSAASDRVANALEATSYLSTPLQNRNQNVGRLYVIGGPERYDDSAIDFVLQLMDHVMPLIENIRLVDSFASYAAEEERRRIARDIHDSVIQPYVGLQLGIAALAQKLRTGNTDVVNNVEELFDLTSQELVELRRYVWGLKAGEERRDILLPAIERFVSRFSTVTGIKVNVRAKGKIEINDRLAAEVFQMVTEGLSNVRRHAICNDASVEIACNKRELLLHIRNPRPLINGNGGSDGIDSHDDHILFTPRSISERADLLGGETVVSIDKNFTVVRVAIPL